jgi:oxygen-independent coproporphyrinogen III oxidase
VKNMITEIITRNIRKILIGKEQKFVFIGQNNLRFQPLSKIDMYIHIPFCKNLCPYCPYNRIKYDQVLVGSYTLAILNEIEQHHVRLGKIEISSIYIGGGTPTTVTDEMGTIINRLREKFNVTGDICIETSPGDLNADIVRKLKRFGVELISLGVQSFNNDCLKSLGRNYNSAAAHSAVNLALSSNFKSVNVDLMFTLPGQSLKNVLDDLKEAVQTGVTQITIYPLFTFSYSSIGQFLKIKRVKMPDFFKRRKMYKEIQGLLIESGYQQVSVWGFKKGDSPRYSSVTRDTYIGLGAGAGSKLPGVFSFNTFSVNDYIETVLSGRLPVALTMDLSPKLRKYYWLYWRFYDTHIDKKQLKDQLGNDIKLKVFFRVARLFGLLKENQEEIRLTERGAFYLHLMQNYFILNYINKVWSLAMKTPWPDKIEI